MRWNETPAAVAGPASKMEIEMATATALKHSAPKQLPPPNADFFQFAELLSDEERAIVKKVRTYMETKVQPVINKYWVEDAFPFELLPSYKELGIAGIGMHGYGCPGGSPLLVALTALEIARTDVSFCTFHGVHTGLAMNSIYLAGTEEQKRKWLPPMARM
jgi:alkylation response protein AidB-like acyl-CoA dehydrogenase